MTIILNRPCMSGVWTSSCSCQKYGNEQQAIENEAWCIQSTEEETKNVTPAVKLNDSQARFYIIEQGHMQAPNFWSCPSYDQGLVYHTA
jgi:hypothetical protein